MRGWLVFASVAPLVLTSQFALGGTGIGKGNASSLHAVGAEAPAPPIERGPVTRIDSAGMNFDCHAPDGSHTFQVKATTKFRRGKDTAGFSDMQTGVNVQVLYHMEGQLVVADLVVLSS
jgi:hypothetical protein